MLLQLHFKDNFLIFHGKYSLIGRWDEGWEEVALQLWGTGM